ncbi:MAG: DUF4168 domain-containing protein [Cyanobacteria bacterium J06642_2]
MIRVLTGLVASLSVGVMICPVWAQSEQTSPTPDVPASEETTPPTAGDAASSPSPSSTPETSEPLAAEDVTAEQVKQLARSLLAIQPLLVQANDEILQATSPAKQQDIEQAFEAEAVKIIEQQGLTVEAYRQMLMLANGDREFKQRVAQQLDELQRDAAAQPANDAQSTSDPEPTKAE